MRYTVKAGSNPFMPPVAMNFSMSPARVGWYILFPENAQYQLPGGDQKDYNKAAGTAFAKMPWDLYLQYPMRSPEGKSLNYKGYRHAAMLGWRWNPDTGLWEYTFYYHVNQVRIIGREDSMLPVMTGQPGDQVVYWLTPDYRANTITSNLMRLRDRLWERDVQEYPNLPCLTRDIGGWFGGTRPAPHDMDMFKRQVTRWLQIGWNTWVPDTVEVEGN